MQILPLRRFDFLNQLLFATVLCLTSCKEEVSKVPEPVGEVEQKVQPIFNHWCATTGALNVIRRKTPCAALC